jgi:dTDP-4-amino-4,6-dideoxygalactose transaminase
MKMLCLHGISTDAWNRYSEQGKWSYQVLECGFKYNMPDIQASIGLPQLRKQEQFIAIRRQYADLYTRAFSDLAEVQPPPDDAGMRHCWHLYSLRLNLEQLQIERGEFIRQLHQRGVGASVHFIPIPLHPYYSSRESIVNSPCPAALELYPRLVSLPIYPAMTEEQVHRVIDAVKDIAIKFSNKVAVMLTAV